MTSTPRTESEAMAQVRTEIGGLRAGLSTRLRELRTELSAAGVDVNAFLATTPLFDGPGPDALAAGTVAADAKLFRSAVELIRSIPFTAGGETCQIGPWDPVFDRILLQHCVPGAFHLFDRRFDRLDPAVRDDRSIRLHEGNPAELVPTLTDESLDYALVDSAVSYADAERLFAALLPKVKPGGHVHVRNYTSWSVFSGIPFGVASVVNGLANRGAVCVVGFAVNPFGYHHILLRKSDAAPADAAADRMRSPLEGPPPDRPPPAPRDPVTWAGFDAFLADFRAREGRPPAILDWTAEKVLASVLPDLPVFSSGITEDGRLASIDRSVDVVAIPPGDPARMTEARRVATALVAEIGPVAPDGAVPIAWHPLTTVVPTVVAQAAPPGRPQRTLADRRILIYSPLLPQPDCDSYSRRLFHLVGFLREAGCDVTCIAAQRPGHDAYVGLLEDRGVRVMAGLEPQEVAALARESRFDWVLFGYWHAAATLIGPLRAAAPSTRLIVDSGDVHFLREARRKLRDADGLPGHLDASFAGMAAREIDVYAAADAVMTVSRKEADLVADIVGDSNRTFTVPDSEDFPPSPLPFEARRGMFIVGNFAHTPTAEALDYLCRRILPHLDPALVAEHPLYVVGSHMPESVRTLAAGLPGVRVVGWVPSVLPYLEQVRVSLVPLLHGAGTKRKLIQALSIGTPSVTTSVGLEGLPLVDDRDVMVADDPVAFASGITRLLTDGALWRRLAAAGRETIRERHSHAVASDRLLAALETIRRSPTRRQGHEPRSVTAAGEAPIDCPFRGLADGHVVTRPAGAVTRPTPRISVVIPTRDRAGWLREAIGSLVSQSADPDSFEVVVVNDGSTDATAQVCGEFDGRLRLTRVDTPRAGIGAAKNVGLDVATADLVLFFDDDDVADRGLVAAHLAAHDRYPLEHVAVLGFTDWHERLLKTEVMRFVTDVGHDLFSYTFLQHGQVLDHTWFWGGRSSCKRSLILRAGGFRPDFTFGSEDIEAGYRISRMVARERHAAGAAPSDTGLAVVFRRDAIQHVIRPITYDDFCRRCEMQGRSQWQYANFYDDPSVRAWCRVDQARARWDEARDLLAARVARVHELERLMSEPTDADRGPLRDELHRLYRWTFDAFKARGILAAATPGPA